MYEADGDSFSGYFKSIGPSSAFLPFGHHPPHGTPCAKAQSSAARSAPVCPPETIFGMLFMGSPPLPAERTSARTGYRLSAGLDLYWSIGAAATHQQRRYTF